MYVHVHIYVCIIYIEMSMYVLICVSRCGLGGIETPMWGFVFAGVAAPEAPVRSPSSDATRDLAGRFLRGKSLWPWWNRNPRCGVSDFARVAVPEAPVRSTSSDATRT
jgi:hypothetical protein